MNTEMLLPVGTSMLTNWMRRLDPDLKLPTEWMGSSVGAVNEPDIREWIPKLIAVVGSGERTCAEVDSVSFWLRKNPGMNLTRITLLVSDTPAAQWVAGVLPALLRTLVANVNVESRLVRRLSADRMREGLIELIRVAAGIVKGAQARDARAVINATPGFKAESVLLSLLGTLLGAELVYLHEHMREIIAIPHVPLRWNLQESHIEKLQHLGEAATREDFRESGVAFNPELAPFVERVGHGKDECWGLSALGTMVVESMGTVVEAQLPDREVEFVFSDSARERAHQPADARASADEIGKQFPFVRESRLYRWFGKKTGFGLLTPADDDLEHRIVRVKLPTTTAIGGMGFKLLTTARTDAEWRFARAQIGKQYGRVQLMDELTDDVDEESEGTVGYAPVGEFADVATEEILLRKFKAMELRNELSLEKIGELEANLTKSSEESTRHQSAAAKAGNRIREANETLRLQEQTIARLERELQESKNTSVPAAPTSPEPGPPHSDTQSVP